MSFWPFSYLIKFGLTAFLNVFRLKIVVYFWYIFFSIFFVKYFLSYLNFFLYHLNLGLVLFFSKFLAYKTIVFFKTFFIWLTFFFLIKTLYNFILWTYESK